MLKMIISARRNPALTRPHFFEHLRHKHWPLLQKYPDVLLKIQGYVQNHAIEGRFCSPLRLAEERDSVIELYFNNEKDVQDLLKMPDYLDHIRPDEQYFNSLADNVMVKTHEKVIFSREHYGRCKRFDFMVRKSETPTKRFLELLEADARRLALDPSYTARVNRLVDNIAVDQGETLGFGSGTIDCVRESWATDLSSLVEAGSSFKSGLPFDLARSFTVFAMEYTMKPVAGL